ncbi:hypothetical protein Aph01nite_60130 [Acrocarpospora phusangensis]|uniref:Uncharacterized protein n=1 Tax=Acrocarpospora phusangensis TaxID=1070424 RepID=A0A919QHJ4_9ACTN|nr:hypothetical protein Aph01nite_60130 [Acrocarpospora phusangensis]
MGMKKKPPWAGGRQPMRNSRAPPAGMFPWFQPRKVSGPDADTLKSLIQNPIPTRVASTMPELRTAPLGVVAIAPVVKGVKADVPAAVVIAPPIRSRWSLPCSALAGVQVSQPGAWALPGPRQKCGAQVL